MEVALKAAKGLEKIFMKILRPASQRFILWPRYVAAAVIILLIAAIPFYLNIDRDVLSHQDIANNNFIDRRISLLKSTRNQNQK